MALIDKLSAIGDAIRAKNGEEVKYTLDGMVEAIGTIETGSSDIPEEAFLITGSCNYKFAYNSWNWFVETYGKKINTSQINSAVRMFTDANTLENIPFALNFTSQTGSSSYMLYNCRMLKNFPKMSGVINDFSSMAQNCYCAREVPESWATDINWSEYNKQTSYLTAKHSNMFQSCYSLRNVPETVLKNIYSAITSSSTGPTSMFYECVSLDEIVGFRGINNTITSNMFSNTFAYTHRLKRLVFDTDNGIPRVQKWKSQYIDLATYTGFGESSRKSYITDYNSGITADKEVKDDDTYAALKDDADWFTLNPSYSRYNHDSAVETINSLPDTSAYIASAGGTNTIKFKGAAGEKTDGGAINTLTPEEIAIATAKGWTVSLV